MPSWEPSRLCESLRVRRTTPTPCQWRGCVAPPDSRGSSADLVPRQSWHKSKLERRLGGQHAAAPRESSIPCQSAQPSHRRAQPFGPQSCSALQLQWVPAFDLQLHDLRLASEQSPSQPSRAFKCVTGNFAASPKARVSHLQNKLWESRLQQFQFHDLGPARLHAPGNVTEGAAADALCDFTGDP